MNEDKKKKLASEIWELEQKCQAGDASTAFMEIENIANNLSVKELLEIALYIEKNYQK